MKSTFLNFLLILTSLMGYLEWGGNKQAFLFEIELELFSKLIINPISVLHPFTLLPLFGQILLIITLFQKTPSKKLAYISMACIGVLLLFMFIVGLMSLNYKILFSTIPFIVVAVFTLKHYKKTRPD